MSKKWYASKTIWVNAILLASSLLVATGVIEAELTLETQATVLFIVNFLLRFITKEPIEWASAKK